MKKVNRKPLGKAARFEVFKRDHFTCQYCGAQPPSVVLVVDHIHPVSKGGGNEETNLTTACEACNQGKKARVLSDVPIRPDADLLYMSTQQEIAELKRLQKSKESLRKQKIKFCDQIRSEWKTLCGADWYPSSAVILSMIDKGSPESAHEAITIVAKRIFDGTLTKSNWYPYAWGVFWNIERGGENASD